MILRSRHARQCFARRSFVSTGCSINSFFPEVGMSREMKREDVLQQHKEEIEWVNSEESKTIFTPPPYTESTFVDLSNLESYLSCRNWKYAFQTDKNNVSTRILSHLLTFPLTISWALRRLVENHMAFSTNISISCIGARAEASLPIHLWKETLFACSDVLTLKQIQFLGPEASPPKFLQVEVNEQEITHLVYQKPKKFLTLVWTRDFFHNIFGDSCRNGINSPNIYFLFNPGLGHSALNSDWNCTFELLIKTGNPIVVTAYNFRDLERDFRWITSNYSFENSKNCKNVQWLLKPMENVFQSHKQFFAGNNNDELVSANKYIYAIRGTDHIYSG